MPAIKSYLNTNILTGTAVITGVENDDRKLVRLSHTLFHPQGGGQRADIGYLQIDRAAELSSLAGEAYFAASERKKIQVIDVRHAEGGEVDHIVENVDGLVPGITVLMSVDQGVRQTNARLHTAGHALADLVTTLQPNLRPRAGHHWPGEARVEFEGDLSEPEIFAQQLEKAAETLVGDDRPIVVHSDQGLRTVTVGSGMAVGCGGTHVSSTGELLGLQIRRVHSKKGIVRVSYEIGAV